MTLCWMSMKDIIYVAFSSSRNRRKRENGEKQRELSADIVSWGLIPWRLPYVELFPPHFYLYLYVYLCLHLYLYLYLYLLRSYSPAAAICWTFSPACLLRFVQRQLGVFRDMFYSSSTYFSHVKFVMICVPVDVSCFLYKKRKKIHIKRIQTGKIFLTQREWKVATQFDSSWLKVETKPLWPGFLKFSFLTADIISPVTSVQITLMKLTVWKSDRWKSESFNNESQTFKSLNDV